MTRVAWASLLAVLAVAVTLRVYAFPARHQVLGYDEIPYVQGSLELLEGIVPAYKYAPAGPQTWLGWAAAGGQAIRYLVAPTAEERAVPLQVRPFVAVNHALFDMYRDLGGLRRLIVVASVVVSVLAVAAAFGVGMRSGGLEGGILAGGLFAAAPFVLRLSEQARPFAAGWAFMALALYLAGVRRGWAGRASAVCMGLAIGSRIDMLALLPLVWNEIYRSALVPLTCGAGRAPARRAWAAVARHAGLTLVATLLIAPWLLTNLIGNLRTIVTVRFSAPPGGPLPLRTALVNLSVHEALGGVTAVLIVGTAVGLVTRRLSRPLACLFVVVLLPSALKDTGHGIEHQGAVLVGLLLTAPAALAALSLDRRLRWAAVAAAVGFPLAVTAREAAAVRRSFVPDDAVAWVSAHVPDGTVLYVPPELASPLPTAARADALWQESMDNGAAEQKFRAGLTRFNLPGLAVPRALSEENMTVERVYRRGWYILGSRPGLPDRRYDIRLFGGSMVFEPRDPVADFARTGGTILWRGAPLRGLGEPVASWVSPGGDGTFVYCSPDVRRRLTP